MQAQSNVVVHGILPGLFGCEIMLGELVASRRRTEHGGGPVLLVSPPRGHSGNPAAQNKHTRRGASRSDAARCLFWPWRRARLPTLAENREVGHGPIELSCASGHELMTEASDTDVIHPLSGPRHSIGVCHVQNSCPVGNARQAEKEIYLTSVSEFVGVQTSEVNPEEAVRASDPGRSLMVRVCHHVSEHVSFGLGLRSTDHGNGRWSTDGVRSSSGFDTRRAGWAALGRAEQGGGGL